MQLQRNADISGVTYRRQFLRMQFRFEVPAILLSMIRALSLIIIIILSVANTRLTASPSRVISRLLDDSISSLVLIYASSIIA